MVLTMNSLISSANGPMPLNWLFPTPVMQVDLTPDDGIAAAMLQQLEVFDRDLFGDPQFSNRNNLT